MPGGLLSITACGTQNVILTGNPSKTFFKCAYCKYTNFGLQKFRLDFDGQRVLRLSTPSTFTFPVPRHADLLLDTYLVVQLPEIWSPILPPPSGTKGWRPYEFKWIKDLGSQLIEEVTFTVGGQIIQRFSGQYMRNMVERDFARAKKDLYYKMTGNVPELNDPANAQGRDGIYPSAYYLGPGSSKVPEPSISSRRLYIPLNIWFTLASSMAFPLVSLQYSELEINVRVRPVRELFTIRDPTPEATPEKGTRLLSLSDTVMTESSVVNAPIRAPYIQPNFNIATQQLHNFLQPPPDVALSQDKYSKIGATWGADVHLLCTYAFLDRDEVAVFAKDEQSYLVKEVYEYDFNNLFGSNRAELETSGLVANWMWFYQRTDVSKRNEWSNYTNWPYDVPPSSTYLIEISDHGLSVQDAVDGNTFPISDGNTVIFHIQDSTNHVQAGQTITPSQQPYHAHLPSAGLSDAIRVNGPYTGANRRLIMARWGLLVDGKYRENPQPPGVLGYAEPYAHACGSMTDGLYMYSFALSTDPYDCQPTGAMNLSRFSRIEFENETIAPPLDKEVRVMTVCDEEGNTIGVNKPVWNIYEYTYNLHVFEERYNVVTFQSGMAGLMFAR